MPVPSDSKAISAQTRVSCGGSVEGSTEGAMAPRGSDRGPSRPRCAAILATLTVVLGLTASSNAQTVEQVGSIDIVSFPSSGWWIAEETPSSGNATGSMVIDTTAPLTDGSAEFSLDGTQNGRLLIGTVDFNGVRFDSLTALSYDSVRTSFDAGNQLSVAMQINVDYDSTDASTAWQGRLVYEPYFTAGSGTIESDVWYSWDLLATESRWWMTGDAIVGGVNQGRICGQNDPCNLATILASYPDAAIHSTLGALFFKAGGPWPDFTGNMDAFTIGIDGASTTYDFGFCPDGNLLGEDFDNDGISDICDYVDAPLTVNKASAFAETGNSLGKAVAVGETISPLDASNGFVVNFTDAAAMDVSGSVSVSDCVQLENSRAVKIQCRSSDRNVTVKFRINKKHADAPVPFKAKLKGLSFSGPLVGPLEVTISTGDIDRVGVTTGTCGAEVDTKLYCK